VPFEPNPVFRAAVLVGAAEAQVQQPPGAAQLVERLMMRTLAVEGPNRFSERLAASIDWLARRGHKDPFSGAVRQGIGLMPAVV
jgi:hypothetical protein